jgi:hypothetical protein
MLVLLFLAAIFEQRRAEHHHAHAADRIEGADPGHFLVEDGGLLARKPATAVLLGPGRCPPAAFAHSLAPAFLCGGLVDRPFDGCQRIALALELGGKVLGQELAHFLAEDVLRAVAVDLRLGSHACFSSKLPAIGAA